LPFLYLPGYYFDILDFLSLIVYPWRCLCFGFSQITRTTPFRRMILHFSQIAFTDGLTFIGFASFVENVRRVPYGRFSLA